jgi:tRNA-specific adenosine deaminase 1
MKDLQDKDWGNGYTFRPFEFKTTSKEFAHRRRQPLATGEKIIPSNISASYIHNPRSPTTPSMSLETLIGGILQGRKTNDIRGASKVCKKRTWKLAIEIATMVAVFRIQRALTAGTYGEVKDNEILKGRRRVKEDVRCNALQGWVRNLGDDGFGVDGMNGQRAFVDIESAINRES